MSYNHAYPQYFYNMALAAIIGLMISVSVHAENGGLLWSASTGESGNSDWHHSSPAITTDGIIYVGSSAGGLHAFNPDGSAKWKILTDIIISSAPAVGSDGTIYIGAVDKSLYAINPNGSIKWSLMTDTPIYSSPAIGLNGVIYIKSQYVLYAVHPNGTLNWSFNAGQSFSASPSLKMDGTIYLATYYKLYAVQPNGTVKWSFTANGGDTYPDTFDSTPALDENGNIYVGDRHNGIHVFDVNGNLKWSHNTLTRWSGASAVIGGDGTIYIGKSNGMLYAFNPDGSLKWNLQLDGSTRSTAAIASDGTIFLNTRFYVYAITPEGTIDWSRRLGTHLTMTSPAIGANGTVYISDFDKLYAIESDAGSLANSYWPKYGHNSLNTSNSYLDTDGDDVSNDDDLDDDNDGMPDEFEVANNLNLMQH